jgi:hypothetical protein
MEHIIQEHTLETPEAHKGEVVLHCMSCGDWVSLQDTAEVIAEFKGAPCPGQRQHDDDDCILGELTESPPFCRHKWTDNVMRKHAEHECYLDEGHDGDHVCGDCVEGYDALDMDADEQAVYDEAMESYEKAFPMPDERPPLHPKDKGGPVFGPSFKLYKEDSED